MSLVNCLMELESLGEYLFFLIISREEYIGALTQSKSILSALKKLLGHRDKQSSSKE